MAKRPPAAAPRPKAPAAQPPPAAPTPPSAGEQATRYAIIAAHDLNRVGTTKVKLAGPMRLYHGQYGVSLICEVIIGSSNGPHRDLALAIGKRSYVSAQLLLGRNLQLWPGKTLDLELDATGQWVNVHDDRQPDVPEPQQPTGNPADDDIPF